MPLRQQYAHATARFYGNSAPTLNALKYIKSLWTKAYDNSIKWNTDF